MRLPPSLVVEDEKYADTWHLWRSSENNSSFHRTGSISSWCPRRMWVGWGHPWHERCLANWPTSPCIVQVVGKTSSQTIQQKNPQVWRYWRWPDGSEICQMLKVYCLQKSHYKHVAHSKGYMQHALKFSPNGWKPCAKSEKQPFRVRHWLCSSSVNGASPPFTTSRTKGKGVETSHHPSTKPSK